MARTPKPSAHHERDGTFRKDRHSANILPVSAPEMPCDLGPKAKACWKIVAKHVVRAGVVSEVDQFALRLMCEAWERYVDACDEVRERGILIEVAQKYGVVIKKNPALDAVQSEWRKIFDILRQFGLTPASRTGLVLATMDDEPDEEREVESILKIRGA